MQKINLKAKICRLCLNTKCDIDLKVIEVIKEVLEIVLPKLNLVEGDEYLICNSCSVKLFAAFNFKSVCTDTEDTIFPYVNSQETPLVDLREIYLKEKGDIQLIDTLKYQKICRLCFQSVGHGFVSLNEVDVDIIDKYIPEVNFSATKDPVICNVCSDSLVTHGAFLSSCLVAQEEKRKVCGDPAEDSECCIKTEEIKIEDDCDSYPPTRLENVETIKKFKGRCNSKNIPVQKRNVTYTCNRCDFKTVHKYSLKRHSLTHASLIPMYISPKSQCESGSRASSSPCPLKRQVRMFLCQKCPYRTHLKDTFACHWSTHEMPSEVKVYQCEICHYRVTREQHFHRHQLRHVDRGETIENFRSRLGFENILVKKKKCPPRKKRTYTCDRCDFKTMYQNSLKRHCWRHVSMPPKYTSPKSLCKSQSRDTSSRAQRRVFRCEKCPYKTRLRYTFMSHCGTHKLPSHVKVYQCEKCHFRDIRKDRFRNHQLRHKNSAETIGSENIPVRKKTLKCNMCSYQTTRRPNFLRHLLRHKKNCEVKTHNCCKCSFRTKYKDSLKRHELQHRL